MNRPPLPPFHCRGRGAKGVNGSAVRGDKCSFRADLKIMLATQPVDDGGNHDGDQVL